MNNMPIALSLSPSVKKPVTSSIDCNPHFRDCSFSIKNVSKKEEMKENKINKTIKINELMFFLKVNKKTE